MGEIYRDAGLCSTDFWPEGGANPELKVKHRKFNIEHPTSNDRPSAVRRRFEVGCWMLDVPSGSLGGTGEELTRNDSENRAKMGSEECRRNRRKLPSAW
jgi:hypothetical protein